MKYLELQKNLSSLGYDVHFFSTSNEAVEYLCEEIKDQIVGIGDSLTLSKMGLAKALQPHNTIIDPAAISRDNFIQIGKMTLTTETFITSVNAIAETGEMVNIDSTGNRVAASLFGSDHVYFVLGVNKIEPTLDKAIWRARNIAAPLNAHRFGYNTPCAERGDKCYDCRSKDRICNALVIYLHKMKNTKDVHVILIDEDLGF